MSAPSYDGADEVGIWCSALAAAARASAAIATVATRSTPTDLSTTLVDLPHGKTLRKRNECQQNNLLANTNIVDEFQL